MAEGAVDIIVSVVGLSVGTGNVRADEDSGETASVAVEAQPLAARTWLATQVSSRLRRAVVRVGDVLAGTRGSREECR